MAATGLFLCVFLIEHLYSNLLLLFTDGGVAFTEWSHTLVHNMFIRAVEIFLFLAIVLHVVQAVYITQQNRVSRPVKYAVYKVDATSSWFSRNMGITGSLILFFIVVHMWQFFVPYRILDQVGGEGQTNMANTIKDAFHNPWYVLIYVGSAMFLAFHLNHGFQSAFTTFGLNNKKYKSLISLFGSFFAFVFVGLGFSIIPILFYFGIAGSTF
jgi:succinate dehydrogenase / fumarate reductase cytochrome b subunit